MGAHNDKVTLLRARLEEIKTETGKLAKLPSLNDADKKRFDTLSAEWNSTKKEYDREKELAAIRAASDLPNGRLPGDNSDKMERDPFRDPGDVTRPRSFNDPWSPISEGRFSVSDSEARARAFDAIVMGGQSDQWRKDATDALERFDTNGNIARQTLLSTNPDYVSAYAKYLRGDEDLLSDAERNAVAKVRDFTRAMTTVDAAGGFLLPGFVDPTVTVSGAGSYSVIYDIADVELLGPGADVANFVTAAQVTASIDGENVAVSDDAATLTNNAITLYKEAVFTPVSIEIAATASNLTETVTNIMTDAYANLQAQLLVTGTGSSQPWGVVVAVAATAGSRVAAISNDAFVVGDVYATYNSLPARFKRSPRTAWVCNPAISNLIRAFGTADSHAFTSHLESGKTPTLLGLPWYEDSTMDSALGTGDDDVLLVMDWSNYKIPQRAGMTTEYIPHLFDGATPSLPTGTRGFYAWGYWGSDSILDDAARLLRV